jgi:hypothetical protein
MPARSRTAVLRLLATLALLALVGAAATGIVRGAPGETIQTIAGSGSSGSSGSGGFGGDKGPATAALLTSPSDVAPAASGDGAYLIADTSNHRIRRVDAAGTITTVAGAGPAVGAAGAFAGDGLAATDPTVRLNQPRSVSLLPTGGGFLIADTGNNRIRRVDDGVIATVAGVGSAAFGGDNGPASSALLNQPGGVAALAGGGFLIADTGNNRVRLVSPGGIVTTVAGTGTAAFTGAGGPAIAAALNAPARVAPLAGGGFLIADTGNNRIRRVDADGTIRTVAGASSAAGFGGDGGPAGKALLNGPEGVAALADGSIAIADSTNERVRLVGVDGTIRTLAGIGVLGFSGDGGDPAAAQLSHPRAVAQDGARLLIADSFNHRIRAVAQPALPPDDSLDPTPPPGISPPVLGKSVVAKARLGRVLVRLPGTGSFVALESIANLPMGSELDAGEGSVVVFFTTNPAGRRAKAIATGGSFIVDQSAEYDRGQRPGELALSGRLRGCASQGAAVEPARAGRGALAPSAFTARATHAAAAPRAHASKRAKQGRRLKVRARGRIRTRGRYGAATVRGTRWTTVDRCPEHVRAGTLVVVSKGLVAVRSFVLRRTVLVPAGARFLAPARRP